MKIMEFLAQSKLYHNVTLILARKFHHISVKYRLRETVIVLEFCNSL